MDNEQEQNKVKLTRQEYMKQWREKNKERMQEIRNTWYAMHKDDEEFKQQKREYNKIRYQKIKLQKQNNENITIEP